MAAFFRGRVFLAEAGFRTPGIDARHDMHLLDPNYPPDIEAKITFIPTEQGGRKSLAFPGYRPQFYYDGEDWDAIQEYPDVESVSPGQTVRTLLRFLSPHAHVGRMHPGMEFQIREGARIVGNGRVTKILNLEESALRAKK